MKIKYLLMSVGIALIGFFTFAIQPMTTNASQNNVYDLSEWQGNFTDNQVKILKKEVPFVILRVQFGSNYYDKTFNHNVSLLKKYGVPYGVYSFSQYINPDDAKKEAQDLYHRAPDAKFYVNDYEQQTVKSGGTDNATLAWVNALRPLVNGRKILFYSYQSFMLQHASKAVSAYDGYWLAAYQSKEPQREHVLWQYTDHYFSPALNQYVDSSLLTSKNIDWFIGGNSKPKPVVPASTGIYSKFYSVMTVRDTTNAKFYNHAVGDKKYAKQLSANYTGKHFKGYNVSIDCKAIVNNVVYYRCYVGKKLVGWIRSSALGPHISYTKTKGTKKVRLNTNYNFYNHIPDSHFGNIKKVANGKSYSRKKVTLSDKAKKDGWRSYYYKCYYRGKLIGWIYQRAF